MTASLNAKVQVVPPSPDATPSGNGAQSSVPAAAPAGGGDQFSVSGRNSWKTLVSGSETPSEVGPLTDEWARTPAAPGDDINNVLGPLTDELHASEPAAEDAVSLEQAIVQDTLPPLSYEDHMQSLLKGKGLGYVRHQPIPERAFSLPGIPKVNEIMKNKELFESPDAIKGLLDQLGAIEKTYRILSKQTYISIRSGGLSSSEYTSQVEYAEFLKQGLVEIRRQIASANEYLTWSLEIQAANRAAEEES